MHWARVSGPRPFLFGGHSFLDSANITLGFLTILQDAGGFTGGYLLTNAWGRPLEFRLTSPVAASKVQTLLYGNSLKPYLFSEVIGKTLLDKASQPPTLLVTDNPEALSLRPLVLHPVAWLSDKQPNESDTSLAVEVVTHQSSTLFTHSKYASETRIIKETLLNLETVDLFEPFQRMAEAMKEARKIGSLKAA